MTNETDIIAALKLQPHPEGGWYRETYRAVETLSTNCLPDRFDGPRCYSTAIYFLLTTNTFSALHRIKSDEQWHFYAGSGLTVHVIHPGGYYEAIKLGARVGAG